MNGLIYVLVNSSMPGQVKVGKTTRTADERAEELSRVTGVPTPFIVAYQEYFDDCSVAEKRIHALLQGRGHRTAGNREFFMVPAHEVIGDIISLAQELNSVPQVKVDPEDTGENLEDKINPSPAWEGVYGEAFHALPEEGTRTPESFQLAKNLYREAIELGCIYAHRDLGLIAQRDDYEDEDAALECFKVGAKQGDYLCYLEMVGEFLKLDDQSKANKCIKYFLSKRNFYPDSRCEKELANTFYYEAFYPIRRGNLTLDEMATDAIIQYRESLLERLEDADSGLPRSLAKRAINWMNDL